MQLVLLILLTSPVTTTAPDSGQSSGASYQTKKSSEALEQCLTRKLSESGDVTSVKIEGTTTLMYRRDNDSPMVIDLAPPMVTVTTKFALGTRKLVEACV